MLQTQVLLEVACGKCKHTELLIFMLIIIVKYVNKGMSCHIYCK